MAPYLNRPQGELYNTPLLQTEYSETWSELEFPIPTNVTSDQTRFRLYTGNALSLLFGLLGALPQDTSKPSSFLSSGLLDGVRPQQLPKATRVQGRKTVKRRYDQLKQFVKLCRLRMRRADER